MFDYFCNGLFAHNISKAGCCFLKRNQNVLILVSSDFTKEKMRLETGHNILISPSYSSSDVICKGYKSKQLFIISLPYSLSLGHSVWPTDFVSIWSIHV